MDYSERNYYLIKLVDSTLNYQQKGHDDYGKKYEHYLSIIREIPSIKFNNIKEDYGFGLVHLLVSCRKEYCNKLRTAINKIQLDDDDVKIYNVSKETEIKREWYERGYEDSEDKYKEVIEDMAHEIAQYRRPECYEIPDVTIQSIMKEFGVE